MVPFKNKKFWYPHYITSIDIWMRGNLSSEYHMIFAFSRVWLKFVRNCSVYVEKCDKSLAVTALFLVVCSCSGSIHRSWGFSSPRNAYGLLEIQGWVNKIIVIVSISKNLLSFRNSLLNKFFSNFCSHIFLIFFIQCFFFDLFHSHNP